MTQLLPNIFAREVTGDADDFILPPNNYEFLFTTKSATEEDAKEVVERIGGYLLSVQDGYKTTLVGIEFHYKQYQSEGYVAFRTPIESLHSLLRSKGLDETKNYAILKKVV